MQNITQAKGRTDLNGKPSKPMASVCLMEDDGKQTLFIRVDDINNPAFWLEMDIDLNKLLARLPSADLLSLSQLVLAANEARSRRIEERAKASFDQHTKPAQ